MSALPPPAPAFRVLTHQRIGSDDILEGGFKPLRKAYSEPVRNLMDTAPNSKSSFLKLWAAKDSWSPLQKKGSFGHGSYKSKLESKKHESEEMNRNFTPAVAVIDPFSSGAILAAEVVKRGYHCVRILAEKNSPVANLVAADSGCQFDATIQHDNEDQDQENAIANTLKQLAALPWCVVAILPGAETGVTLADSLSTLHSNGTTRSNPIDLSPARRNKYVMGETIRKAGVRAVKQTIASTWSEAQAFLTEWNPDPYKVIVKPNQSAGSDDVFLCTSEAEVKKGFDKINGAINGLGIVNEGVLLQEFLEGTEYVIDSVSRDGVHKVTAIWQYDKREVNNQFNVYFGMKLIPDASDMTNQMVAYQREVLDAVGIVNGPAHAEVMWTKTGPCLVEVGSRCHGGEGTWKEIANKCVGYNQITTTLDAYLEEGRFMALPSSPKRLQKFGREAFIVARESGVVKTCPGFGEIRSMRSFLSEEIMQTNNTFMPLTIDCFTRPAAFQLLHTDEEVVERDYLRVRELEENGMWDFSVKCATKPETGAVVVVDPFSSGAQLAAKVVKLGYKLIMLFSELDSPVAALVQSGTDLRGETIQHDDQNPDAIESFDATVSKLKSLPYPILAILPGAETGVLLADKLADKFETRTNSLYLSNARRNKYIMGETIRRAGVRAVKQTIASDWDSAQKFLREWNPSPYKVIVKPNQSAGSDDVFLCTSEEEVKKGFDKINGAINGLGVVNEGVLLQEFLEGKEYVVDSVSRDGVHKVTAIWEYDKREVNGQFNVYFGMRLRAVETDLERQIVQYQRSVLEALEIRNGPAHAEVMMTATGPCLVEVGSRCHGGEGTWQPIADGALGYNQIDVALDAYIRPDDFDKIPSMSTSLQRYGREVFLVARENGKIKSMPGVDTIMSLKSFLKCEMAVQPGDQLKKTVDCFTRPGAVQLIHDDPAVVEADYQTLRALEIDGMFELE
ncbi:hypothetical protein TrLO_g10212 [Triparma laevis f. longispina]|uniref:ATP-grasp domain-containing protein n=1 Tax=Triparma laevis f. longispina TaxID=1714387 RepID=A0A9W7F396_9STRA|nr:hypothetical protein TrLO_g10212 [Triparma laevis f. longispina]